MMTNARATYMDASIATASPARLLVMLYERLVLDVQRGVEAHGRQDLEEVHRQLTHAQDIVTELHSSLRPEAFKGGRELLALYGYLHRQLVLSNIHKDVVVMTECLRITSELCDTWRQAALESATSAAKIA
jgi:flagellar protein FliS